MRDAKAGTLTAQVGASLRRMPGLLGILALVATGCAGDDGGSATPTTPSITSPSTAVAYQPEFEAMPCEGELFAPPRLPEDRSDIECGTLTVPEDRQDPTGAQVVLPVAVLKATDPDPEPDPVVFLQGGPGGSGFDPAYTATLGDLFTNRDVILFDQRGTGLADPSLDCPEVEDVLHSLLETVDPAAEEKQRLQDAYGSCFDRLRDEGVALDQYNTPVTVADLEDLRTTLGVDEWNLYGYSYGTTVGLEAVRSGPESLRSVTLDAAAPPFADNVGPAGIVVDAERAFNVLYDTCDDDPACAEAHPDLEANLAAARSRFDDAPYETTVTDPSGAERRLQITGEDVVWALYKGQYLTSLLPALPGFIDGLASGDSSPIDLFLGQLADAADLARAEGVYAAVTCADRARTEPTDLARLRADEPLYSSVLLDDPQFPEICVAIDTDAVEDAFDTVGSTDVPVLVFGSDNDPRLDPADGEETAQRLGPTASFFSFPGIGHGSVGAHPCPTAMLGEFVDDPTGPPDDTCTSQMTPPAYDA